MEAFLRLLVAAGCGYEVVAIVTGRIPTISAHMWRLPTRVRWVVWASAVAILTDHFFTRWFV